MYLFDEESSLLVKLAWKLYFQRISREQEVKLAFVEECALTTFCENALRNRVLLIKNQ